MGKALGEQFCELWQTVAWVNMEWTQFVDLFGSKPSRVELLNQTAPAFFRIVQDSLWKEIVLTIARLTDPALSSGKTNLTLCNLPDLVDDSATRETVSALITQLLVAAKFCRDWRNRHIAHADLSLALKKSSTPLETASRKQVDETLSLIVDVLNAVERHYADSETYFKGYRPLGGAMSLLYVLDDGIRKGAKRRERRSRGQISEEDYPRDI